MCEKQGASAAPRLECSLYSLMPLVDIADICWRDRFEPLLSECGFGTDEGKSTIRNNFYNLAIHHDHGKKTQRDRLDRIIDFFFLMTLKNVEVEESKNVECFKKSLMKEFKEGETLDKKVAKAAAIKLAGRLVDLMINLGKKADKVIGPILSMREPKPKPEPTVAVQDPEPDDDWNVSF